MARQVDLVDGFVVSVWQMIGIQVYLDLGL